MTKKRFTVFWAVIISVVAVVCLSGCSSITVGGKKLRNPDKITLFRVGLYSYDCDVRDRKEINRVFSFFDGAKFVLSDDTLTEEDGNINLSERVWIYFGDDCYYIDVAQNGRAECTFGDRHYITQIGAVDYGALEEFVNNKIQEYLDSIKAERS